MSKVHEPQPHAPRVGAVVVAAGESRRMKGVDKIFFPLDGKPIVWHCISVLRSHPLVREIVLVTSQASVAQAEALIAEQSAGDSVSVCAGGERRQDSVLKGLERLGDCDLVIVHDGARPFITSDLLDNGIAAAQSSGAAVAAAPVKDTIKRSDDGATVTRTLERDSLWAAQTPQIFKTSLLKEAHRRVSIGVTDDASMIEAMGCPVSLFPGSYYNIKVTTPEDLIFAQAIINTRNTGNTGNTGFPLSRR